jgi:hypothetical protein
MTRHVLLFSTIFTLFLGASTAPAGPSGLTWNRKALELTTQPAAGGPPGTHDIVFTWSFEFDGEGAVSDLGTEAQFSWGPRPAAPGNPACIIWDIQGAAADSCGTTVIDGVPTTLSCDSADDLCHGPELIGVIPAVPLELGDQITVILFPTKGAAAETDTSDDSLSIVFGPTHVDSKSWGAVKDIYR